MIRKNRAPHDRAALIFPLRMAVVPIAALILLAGCATESDFKPRSSAMQTGYSDRQLSVNLYRVAFSGAGESTLEEVEYLLMRHAAEITLQQGYTHFAMSM